ncbi:VanW family protein [Desertibacillus haloalkaliphilus]|uniref:VanW family protein n=1 Tax=Desertibacillus haloalkaliphilus TaxID=1328930 RepID=UPI001C2740A9|nr:VanW family protein [Desertibacillus haloalkaliphilus]MBU8905052.1 VanW family protein [Desertibacillus haloalkaliphilus]
MTDQEPKQAIVKLWMLILLQALLLYFLTMAAIPVVERINGGTTIPEGSMLAGVHVGGLTVEEAEKQLHQHVDDWKKGAPLVVETVAGEELFVTREAFDFEIEKTIATVTEQLEQPWYAFWQQPTAVTIPMIVDLEGIHKEVTEGWPDDINRSATVERVLEQARYLRNEAIEAVYDEDMVEEEVLARATLPITSQFLSLEKVIEQIDGHVIQPNASFSLDHVLGDTVEFGIDGRELRLLASTLYIAVLGTNFDIIERHSQGSIPEYTTPGLEADFRRGERDLVFKNTNSTPYTLSAISDGQQLTVEISGRALQTSFDYEVVDEEEFEPRTIHRYDPALPVYAEVIQHDGENGYRATVNRYSYDDRGKVVSEEWIATDYYPPTARVVLRSTVTEAPEETGDGNEEEQDQAQRPPEDEGDGQERDGSDQEIPGEEEDRLEEGEDEQPDIEIPMKGH